MRLSLTQIKGEFLAPQLRTARDESFHLLELGSERKKVCRLLVTFVKGFGRTFSLKFQSLE